MPDLTRDIVQLCTRTTIVRDMSRSSAHQEHRRTFEGATHLDEPQCFEWIVHTNNSNSHIYFVSAAMVYATNRMVVAPSTYTLLPPLFVSLRMLRLCVRLLSMGRNKSVT